MGFNYNKRTAEHFAKHPLPFGSAPPNDVEQPKADTPEEADKPQQPKEQGT